MVEAHVQGLRAQDFRVVFLVGLFKLHRDFGGGGGMWGVEQPPGYWSTD